MINPHLVLTVLMLVGAIHMATAQKTSSLWGNDGELYDPARLPDFSYAGYSAGESPIPDLDPTMNVKDFGAEGNGRTDDTSAIKQAILSAKSGSVLYFPPGRYIITQKLVINKRVSLKGAGSEQTAFVFPKSLADIYANVDQTATGNTYSSKHGFIEYATSNPHNSRTFVGTITTAAARGTNTIKVSTTRGLTIGQWVSVTMGTPKGGEYFFKMNLNVDRGCTDGLCTRDDQAFTFQSRIAKVIDSTTLLLERPLPYDLIMEFKPVSLYTFKPTLAQIGIDGFTFDFVGAQRYLGHYKERGWNGIQMNYIANSFIRDVQFINADTGINLFNSFFVTIQSIIFTHTPNRMSTDGRTGHHGINLKQTSDCLVQYFEVNSRLVHDLTVDKFARGSVFSQGAGWDLNMDHHKAQNYGSLWVQLDTGSGSRAYTSGGAGARDPAAGSLTTFWNLQAAAARTRGLKNNFGPYLNFVAVDKGTVWPAASKWTVTWLREDMAPREIRPVNIFLAMREKRLNTDDKVSDLLGGKGTGGVSLTSL